MEFYCETCDMLLDPNDLINSYHNQENYQCADCFDRTKEEDEETEEDEEEIIFCCYECDREIIKDSKDHNEAGSCNGKDWLCIDCMCDLEDDETGLILVKDVLTKFYDRTFYEEKIVIKLNKNIYYEDRELGGIFCNWLINIDTSIFIEGQPFQNPKLSGYHKIKRICLKNHKTHKVEFV